MTLPATQCGPTGRVAGLHSALRQALYGRHVPSLANGGHVRLGILGWGATTGRLAIRFGRACGRLGCSEKWIHL